MSFRGHYREVCFRIRTFVRNVWFFRKELASHSCFDYQGYLLFGKRCAEDLLRDQESDCVFKSVNSDKYCKHLKRVIGAYTRLIEDNYDIQNISFEGSILSGMVVCKDKDLPTVTGVRKHASSKRKEDLKMIGKFVEKHLLNCWS